jgi:hypothetical protein
MARIPTTMSTMSASPPLDEAGACRRADEADEGDDHADVEEPVLSMRIELSTIAATMVTTRPSTATTRSASDGPTMARVRKQVPPRRAGQGRRSDHPSLQDRLSSTDRPAMASRLPKARTASTSSRPDVGLDLIDVADVEGVHVQRQRITADLEGEGAGGEADGVGDERGDGVGAAAERNRHDAGVDRWRGLMTVRATTTPRSWSSRRG